MAIRGYSYAMWLGMPLVAAAALRLFAALKLKTLVARLAAGLLLTPMVVSAGAITIAHATGFDDTDSFARPASRHCFATASYAALARLPAGLVATDVSFGPFLLALTPHSVHGRALSPAVGSGIVIAHRALAAPPDEARRILAGANGRLRHGLRAAAARRPAGAGARPQPVGPAAGRRGPRLARAGARHAALRGLPGQALNCGSNRPPASGQVLAAQRPPPI